MSAYGLPDPKRLITPTEIAAISGYSRQWICALLSRGEIKGVKTAPGRHGIWLVFRKDAEKWLAS